MWSQNNHEVTVLKNTPNEECASVWCVMRERLEDEGTILVLWSEC